MRFLALLPFALLVLTLGSLALAARKTCKWGEATVCAALVLFLLYPGLHHGFVQRPLRGFPKTVAYLSNLAGLYTVGWHSVDYYHVQIRESGSKTWITIPENEISRQKTLGNFTRLRQLLNHSVNFPHQREPLARWIAARYWRKHPRRPPPEELRFIVGLYAVPPKEPPKGEWAAPPFDSGNPNQYIYSTHRLVESQ